MTGRFEDTLTEDGKYFGRGLNLAPEKFKPITELYTKIGNQKSLMRINKAQDKDKRSSEKHNNIGEVKTNVKEIQKTVSCVFQKNLNEKTKRDSNDMKNETIGSLQKKKNKSWDHFQQVSSKLPLAQRVSDALKGVKRQFQATEVDLLRNDQWKLNKSSTGNFAKEFSTAFDNLKKTSEQLPEKSLSYQYLEFTKRARELCKTLSLEAGPIKKPEPTISDQFKNTSAYRSEINVKPDQVQSLLRQNAYSSEHLRNSELLHNEKDNQFIKKPEISKYSFQVPQKFEKIPIKSSEMAKNEYAPLCSHESNKQLKNQEYATKSNNNFWPVAKNIRICHCPHFHTEEGMRKACLQCSSDAKEFGQRFRVKYVSKDKATITENESGRKKLKPKSDEAKKLNKAKSKYSEKEKTLEDKSKTALRRNKKSTHILETTKQSKKLLENNGNVNETRNRGDAEATKEAQKLKKLFTKLNSVERFLAIEKSSESPEGILKPNSRVNEILENVTENNCSEQNDLRRKLKSKIVQHFRNWLDLEFDLY